MLLVNAVNTEGRPLEIFVKDGRIAAVGQELEALAGENETVIDAGDGMGTADAGKNIAEGANSYKQRIEMLINSSNAGNNW